MILGLAYCFAATLAHQQKAMQGMVCFRQNKRISDSWAGPTTSREAKLPKYILLEGYDHDTLHRPKPTRRSSLYSQRSF
jgi:hypothetical protein